MLSGSSRLPLPKAKLSGIEALRGLAAVAVVAYHASRHVDKAFGAPGLAALLGPGQAGVDVFFTLSGFIILHVHGKDIGRPARLAHYLGRRFTRLFPLYWLALAATVVMGSAASRSLPEFGRLVFSVFLLPSHQEPLLGVAWTLQFEVLFYAAFALLIVSRALGSAVLAAWFVCIACHVSGVNLAVLPPQITGAYGLEFFVGMLSAHCLASVRIRRPGILASAGLVCLFAALVIVAHLSDTSGVSARLLYSIPAAMLILGLASLNQAGICFAPAWASRIGSASYAIYLFQFVFIGLVWQAIRRSGLDHRMTVTALFLILAVCAVGGGVLASWWIEKPLLKRLRA